MTFQILPQLGFSFSNDGGVIDTTELFAGAPRMLVSIKGFTVSTVSTGTGGTGQLNLTVGSMADVLQVVDPTSIPIGNAGSYTVGVIATPGTSSVYHFPLGDGITQDIPSGVNIILSGAAPTGGGNTNITVQFWGELIPVEG